jgi:hypothetical protein
MRSIRSPWLVLALLALLLLPIPGGALPLTAAGGPIEPKGGWHWEFDSKDQPYPEYVADPRRPRMQFGVGLFDSEIPATSAGRVLLDAGTRYTLAKVKTDRKRLDEFSIDIEGALFAQFDLGNQQDAVGWDGVLGAFVVYDWNRKLTLRAGYKHLSAHLGDEYIEVTGRQRINYTRVALPLGVAWQPGNGITVYVEPSWAIEMGNADRQRPWAVEGGLQYQGPFDRWRGSTARYAGVHFRSFEESDWNPGIALQAGYLVKNDPTKSNIRLGLEAYTGRAILGEFALDFDESYVSLGLFLDFY